MSAQVQVGGMVCRTDETIRCSSANPQAIISSRLNAYLKRPWTALSPCPLAKTLIPTHPRRIYFYLTNQPHQPLPAFSSESPLPSNRRAVISPSLSSDDDQEGRKRAALSPSPEVDLSSPEVEEADEPVPPTPAGSLSGRSSLARDGTHPDAEVMSSRRAMSPPLEGDEREFTQTASVMQSKRSFSSDVSMVDSNDGVHASIEGEAGGQDDEEGDEHTERQRHREAAAALFGQTAQGVPTMSSTGMSSPEVRPSPGLHVITNPRTMTVRVRATSTTKERKGGRGAVSSLEDDLMSMEIERGSPKGEDEMLMNMGWEGDLRSPESVELEELDDLLGEF